MTYRLTLLLRLFSISHGIADWSSWAISEESSPAPASSSPSMRPCPIRSMYSPSPAPVALPVTIT